MSNRKWRIRPSPAIVIASIAMFVAMSGVGVAALKLTPNSVTTKDIKNHAVTQTKLGKRAVTGNKLRDGAVTTAKFASGAIAPNAAMLAGVAPGRCQTGWLKASMVVDTSALTDATPDAVVPAFDCASKAADAVTIHRTGVGRYTLTLTGIDSGIGISSSANVGGGAANVVTAASKVDAQGKLNLTVWNNGDAALVDGKTVSLIVF
jgi:hypothetical protein